MANEFKHKDIGSELSRAEWEATNAHETDGQVANDMLYYNGINWVRATKATILGLLNIADGADVTGSNAPQAHKNSHAPAGSDPLDAAAPAVVQDAAADGITKGIATFEANDFDSAFGKIDLDDTVLKSLGGDSGITSPSSHVSGILGGTGINTAASGQHVIITGHDKYLDTEAVTAAKTVKLDDFTAPDNNIDLNATTLAHGLLKKLNNNAANFMNGQGNWTVPGGGGATKEFFIPATYPASNASVHGYYPIVKCDALNETVYISFYVPHDFNSITSAAIIVIPLASQAAADWDIRSTYAAIGEDITIQEEIDVSTSYNITVNDVYTFFEVNISGILSVLVAGDYVGIRLTQSTTLHNVSVLGIRFRYN